MKVAVINCGSSSIKYEVFGLPDCVMLATGLIEKIGGSEGRLRQRRRKADGSVRRAGLFEAAGRSQGRFRLHGLCEP